MPIPTLARTCVVLSLFVLGCLPAENEPHELHPGSFVVAAPPPDALNVMTLNVRKFEKEGAPEYDFGARLPRLVAMIERYGGGPHLLALSELKTGWARQLHDALEARPGAYAWSFVEVHAGIEKLAVFVRDDRVRIVAKNVRAVPRAERVAACLNQEGRCPDCASHDSAVQVVRLEDVLHGRAFYVYNSHFPVTTPCERSAMARIVTALAASRTLADAPALFMGDLNGHVDEHGVARDAAYQALVAKLQAENAFFASQRALPAASKTFNGYADSAKKTRQGGMIDHILYEPHGFTVLASGVDRTLFTEADEPVECEVVAPYTDSGHCIDGWGRSTQIPVSSLRYYSDHWAVWASFSW